MEKTLLESGKYYHIYNRGNNGQDIFLQPENYLFFLERYDQYISPVCDTLAWVLLRNHFHFLVYIKTPEEIVSGQLKYNTVEIPKKIDVHLQFGHFFNAYAKAINKRFNRTGSLFEKNFERKEVTDTAYLRKLIHYIHHNPVKHKFAEHIADYPWSSYGSLTSAKPTKLNRKLVLDLFNDEDEFIRYHTQNQEYDEINNDYLEP